MDQEESLTDRKSPVSAAASAALEAIRVDRDINKREMLRRVESYDPQFSETQLWRIQTGKSPWTLDRFVFVAEALGVDPPMLLDRILRGHDILELLRARDGPEGRDGAQPTSPTPQASDGPPVAPDHSAVDPDEDH